MSKRLVDYSKVSSRHKEDERFEKHSKQPTSQAFSGAPSATYDAVVRLMAGQQERTLSEKMKDSNRPTWEQYKKDNEDKLDISGADKKKMEEYRKELDAEREKFLQRGVNRRQKDYASTDDSSSSVDSHRQRRKSRKDRRKKKHKKKDKKRNRKRGSDSEDSDDSSVSSDRRRKKSHKNKKSKKSKDDQDREKYRLSSFFNKGSESE